MTLCFLYSCTFILGTSQVDRAWWSDTKGKLKREGKTKRGRGFLKHQVPIINTWQLLSSSADWKGMSSLSPVSYVSVSFFTLSFHAYTKLLTNLLFFDIYLLHPSGLHPHFIIPENNSVSLISLWQKNNQREGEGRDCSFLTSTDRLCFVISSHHS